MSPSCISWIMKRMHALISTVIIPVRPMGRVTFFKRSLAVVNVCKTTCSCAWYFRRLSPFGCIWFCANDTCDLGRKPWYPQASIFRQNFSVNIAGVNMYGLSENLSFPPGHRCAIDPLNDGNKQFLRWVFDILGIGISVYGS
jgi:hypothetical protein